METKTTSAQPLCGIDVKHVKGFEQPPLLVSARIILVKSHCTAPTSRLICMIVLLPSMETVPTPGSDEMLSLEGRFLSIWTSSRFITVYQ